MQPDARPCDTDNACHQRDCEQWGRAIVTHRADQEGGVQGKQGAARRFNKAFRNCHPKCLLGFLSLDAPHVKLVHGLHGHDAQKPDDIAKPCPVSPKISSPSGRRTSQGNRWEEEHPHHAPRVGHVIVPQEGQCDHLWHQHGQTEDDGEVFEGLAPQGDDHNAVRVLVEQGQRGGGEKDQPLEGRAGLGGRGTRNQQGSPLSFGARRRAAESHVAGCRVGLSFVLRIA
mmetsp:Transcript_93440/g.285940  ORF Transcript_93440/g.285940 Transcript_93440/m.285940 type:complete len:228 (-) Transcript_93440:230-913(-)